MNCFIFGTRDTVSSSEKVTPGINKWRALEVGRELLMDMDVRTLKSDSEITGSDSTELFTDIKTWIQKEF